MDYNLLFLAISCLVAIFSVVVVFLYYKRNIKLTEQGNELSRENNRINKELMKIQKREQFPDWEDIEHYIRVIAEKMIVDSFVPDWIIVDSERDVIVAAMIIQSLRENGKLTKSIPVSVSMITREHVDETDYFCESIRLTNDNWYVVIQKHLPIANAVSDKVLVVRDHSSTGVCFSNIIAHLVSKNITENNIRTACIAHMEHIKFKTPDYFCLTADNIWFPWGKSL
ncbi:hypothetical protein FACS1894188_00510 [Clostridia bacterium]|nr:hypothetical protein FACS1894188_00510 [Clostridia bacterium]